MRIGDRIREYRKNKEWTMKELAEKINVSQGTISQYENHIRAPKKEHVETMSHLFNLTFEEKRDLLELRRKEKEETNEKEEKEATRSDNKSIKTELYPGFETEVIIKTKPIDHDSKGVNNMMETLIRESIEQNLQHFLQDEQIHVIRSVKEKLVSQIEELDVFAKSIEDDKRDVLDKRRSGAPNGYVHTNYEIRDESGSRIKEESNNQKSRPNQINQVEKFNQRYNYNK